MEGGDHHHHQSIGIGNGGSRWNPTKEQINLLENLYKQGLRTPTAEQIQQITNRLRAFGHIEGKNVFYWFQNHKARQRQKQKQENLAYFNRFFHATAPVFPPYQNVICTPCYIPPSKNDHHPGFYQQYPKVPLPAAASFKRTKLIPETLHDKSNKHHPTSQMYNKSMHDHPGATKDQQTLDLFPIHPTGLLQSRVTGTETDEDGVAGICDHGNNEDDLEQPFFDFFCGDSN